MSEPEGTTTADEIKSSPRVKWALGKLQGGSAFLDIGCNDGFFLKQVKADRVVGLDSDKSLVEQVQNEGYEAHFGYSWKLPFEDNTFDRVHFGQVIAHMKVVLGIQSLMEIYRVLKPKGVAIITTVVGPNFSSALYFTTHNRIVGLTEPWFHIHEWEPPELLGHIRNIGFTTKVFTILPQVEKTAPTYKAYRFVQCWKLSKNE